jgi:hypothetical protein
MENTADPEFFRMDCLHQELVGVLFDMAPARHPAQQSADFLLRIIQVTPESMDYPSSSCILTFDMRGGLQTASRM